MSTHFTATKSGNWNDPSIWDTAPPNSLSLHEVVNIENGATITIPKGLTVNLDNAFVQLAGSLIVDGTLNINIYTNAWQMSVITTFPGTNRIQVNEEGTINIGSKTQPHDGYYTVIGIAMGNGQFINKGTLNITSSTKTNSGWGVLVDAITFTNEGKITTACQEDPAQGLQAACAIGIRSQGSFVNGSSGIIQIGSSDSVGSSINIDTGSTFENEGKVLNYGLISNQGNASNSGEITQNYPTASYHGPSKVTGAGKVFLTGPINTQMSIQDTMPGQQNFYVPEESSLTINKPFAIPSNFGLDADGQLIINSTIANDGILKLTLSDALSQPTEAQAKEATTMLLSSSQSSIEQKVTGSGQVIIKGTIDGNTSTNLGAWGKNIQIEESITVTANATLIIPANVTLTIENGGSLSTNAAPSANDKPGRVDIKGTIVNKGSFTNNGKILYVFPSYRYSGNDSVGSGGIAIAGIISSNLTTDTFPRNSISIPSAQTLTVSSNTTLSIPTGYSLITEADSETPGQLSVRGTIDINGTLTNDGGVSSNGTINLYNKIENSGVFSSTGMIDHNFPATFTGKPANFVSRVNLKGTTSADVNVGNMGYGINAQFFVNQNETLTVGSSLTNPRNVTINNEGTITCNKGIQFQNDGILVHNFTEAKVWRFSKTIISTFTCDSFSGSGLVALNGVLNETRTLDSIVKVFGKQENFIVRSDEIITYKNEKTPTSHFLVNMPSIRLEVRGQFWFEDEGLYFHVSAPPSLAEENAVNFSLAFTERAHFGLAALSARNSRIPQLAATCDKGVGIWIHDLNSQKSHSYIFNYIRLQAHTSNADIDNFNCGMLIEYAQIAHHDFTHPDTFDGEVSSSPTNASIYCNHGNIIGAYSGKQPEGIAISNGKFVYPLGAKNVPGINARPLDQQRKPTAFNQ